MERNRSTGCIIVKVNRVELLPGRGTRAISPTVHLVADLLFISYPGSSYFRRYFQRQDLYASYSVTPWQLQRIVRYGREIRTDRPINRASIELIDRLEIQTRFEFEFACSSMS